MLHQEWTASLEAQIQNRVAEFLALKSKLLQFKYHPDLKTREKADILYQNQLSLEQGLKETLKRIDNVKAGAYTIGDIAAISAFLAAMVTHINEVKKLGVPPAKPMAAAIPLGVGLGVLALIAIASWPTRKRRRG